MHKSLIRIFLFERPNAINEGCSLKSVPVVFAVMAKVLRILRALQSSESQLVSLLNVSLSMSTRRTPPANSSALLSHIAKVN